MEVQAVVSVVIQKLTDMLNEESLTHNRVIKGQLEEIRKEVENMKRFLIKAEDKQEDQEDKSWAREYLSIAYDVEDEIETFALRIARQRKRLGFLMNHALFFKKSNAYVKLRRKMKKIRTELNNKKPNVVEDASPKSMVAGQCSQHNQRSISCSHSDENDAVEEDPEKEETKLESTVSNLEIVELSPKSNALPKHNGSISAVHTGSSDFDSSFRIVSIATHFGEHLQRPKLMFTYSYERAELGIVGEDVDTWANRLIKEGNRVISIVGVVGSGKTTLAHAIYGRRDIKRYFDYKAWVFISKEYTTTDLLLSLLKQVGNFKDQGALTPNEEELKQRLSNHLKEKKYLVVMDNVWTSDVWEKLKHAFPDTRNGSKILLTTCKTGVANHANPESPHYDLTPLSKRDSWKMFLNLVGLEEKKTLESDAILKLKQKILEICNGLPLNIVLLGGLLSTKERKSYVGWSSFLPDQQVNWNTDDLLWLSYKDLPVHLKLCLLYLVLFPKEFDIPVRRLLRLWLAEGFVTLSQAVMIGSGSTPELNRTDPHTSLPKMFPEDTLQEYFDDLVKRSMIQISKLRSDGSPRRCRLLGVLHDYLLPKARDIHLFFIHRNLDPRPEGVATETETVRRVVEYVDINNNFLNDPSQLQFLRSYLSFNFRKKDTPAKEVGSFVKNIIGNGFGLLRVLDLEGVYKPSLPENLGDLFHLRYLGLRWTFLDTLPSSVGDLPYLEALDVKHTYINSLPKSIWKLKHLRHLNLNYGTRLDMPVQWRTTSPALLTLWGLFVDGMSRVNDGLNRLCDLRELGITFHLSSTDQQDLVEWIAKLTSLRSLRLRSKDDTGRPSELSLKTLSCLTELTHLNLMGKLERLPCQSEFPLHVMVLTLSVSQLKEDPMPTLGLLQNLTVLRLLADSCDREEITCLRGGFGKLRVLKLWVLKKLKKWVVEEGAMQRLKELNIRCCDKLENIPPILLQQSTFEELILTNMPEEFESNLKSDHKISITRNKFEFSPLPWEQDHDTSSVRDVNVCPSVIQSDSNAGSVGGSNVL